MATSRGPSRRGWALSIVAPDEIGRAFTEAGRGAVAQTYVVPGESTRALDTLEPLLRVPSFLVHSSPRAAWSGPAMRHRQPLPAIWRVPHDLRALIQR